MRYGWKTSGAHAAFWVEILSIGWSRSSLDPLATKLDNGLPTDRIIGGGCRRSVKRSTANVARVEELIFSHGVAPSSVLCFH